MDGRRSWRPWFRDRVEDQRAGKPAPMGFLVQQEYTLAPATSPAERGQGTSGTTGQGQR